MRIKNCIISIIKNLNSFLKKAKKKKKKGSPYKICPLNLPGIELVTYLRAIPLGTVTVTSRGERNGLSIAASGKCGVIG